MKYMILDGQTLVELSEKVQNAINLGYEPQGGIAVVEQPIGMEYLQAMVKEEK